MANLKEVVGIKTDQDFQTLVNTGTLTYGDETIEYSDETLYFTPNDTYTKQETENLIDSEIQTLSAQCVKIVDIINNLTSTATDKPLSALQGKALNDMISTLMTELSDLQQDVADNMTDIGNLQGADAQNVKLTGNQTIQGTKNFTGTFQINGGTLSYDSSTNTFSI